MATEIHISSFTILDYEHTGDGDDQPHAPHIFMAYVFPFLACSAIFGNTLFVISIALTDLIRKTTGILLMSSNISNIVLTIASSCIVYYPWLFAEQVSGSRTPCNIMVYIYRTLSMWSVYLLSCACIERFIAICHPMSKYSIRSQSVVRQSLTLMLSSFIASLIANSPLMWFSGLTIIEEIPSYGNLTLCHYTKENWYMKIHEYIEMTFYSILPFIIICFCNVNIIRTIYFHKNLLESFRGPNESKSNSGPGRRELPHRTQAVKLAIILLPISLLHLIFSLIVVITIILEEAVAVTPHQKLLMLTLSYNASQLQAGYYFYANIALSSVFRNVFRKMFKCDKSLTSDNKSDGLSISTSQV